MIAAQSKSISLLEFLNEYGDKLPLSIVVTSGYHGESNNATISAFDKLNIHFVKKTTVVITKSLSGEFRIPITSALEFCLVYNPNNNFEEALKGFKFNTIADILKSKHKPKVVCCTQQWRKNECNVTQGELLIIPNVPTKSSKKSNTFMVYSITFSEEKCLTADCEGHFTTCPSALHLPLLEMVQLIPDAFPCQACIYMQKPGVRDMLKNIPRYLSSEVLTLIETTTEVALVASSAFQEEPKEIIMEIPVDIPEVKVAVISSDNSEDHAEKLYGITCHVFETYNPKTVQNLKDANSVEQYSVQSFFYSSIRTGYEKDGIQCNTDYAYIKFSHKPHTYIEKTNTAIKSPQISASADRSSFIDTDSIYDDCLSLELPVSQAQSTLYLPALSSRPEMPLSQSQLQAVEIDTKRSSDTSIEPLHTTVNDPMLIHNLELLYNKIIGMEKKIHTLSDLIRKSTCITDHSNDPDTIERNRKYVSTLSCEKIRQLLHAMGIARYADIFFREQVNGELLLQLDEKVLQEELGMDVRIHRLRLLKVISGHQSAVNILKKSSPEEIIAQQQI